MGKAGNSQELVDLRKRVDHLELQLPVIQEQKRQLGALLTRVENLEKNLRNAQAELNTITGK